MMWVYYSFCEIGIMRYIPMLILCGMSILCRRSLSEELVILKSFELFLPPLVTFWIVPLFFNYVNIGTKEVYLSYPCSRKTQGILRVFLFGFMYAVFLTIIFFITIPSWREYIFYVLILSMQVFFYAAIAFWLIITSGNIVISFGIIWAYAGLQVLDTQHIFSVIGICFYDIVNGKFSDIALKLIAIFIVAVTFIIWAQRRFDNLDVV